MLHANIVSSNDPNFLHYYSRQNLRTLFCGADSTALHLLKAMLEFDPTKRITVDQALRHSFLADFHTPGMEASADRPLDAELELLGEAPENLRATVRHTVTTLSSVC